MSPIDRKDLRNWIIVAHGIKNMCHDLMAYSNRREPLLLN